MKDEGGWMMNRNGQSSKLFKLVIIALFGSISVVLMLLNFPLPLLPQYLKVDFSEIPALIAAILFTPLAGIAVEGLKNVLYFIYTGASDPVGVVANFTAGLLFVVPAAMFYRRFKSTKGLVSGIVVSIVITAVSMSVLNYFFILPAYSWFMGMEMMSAQMKWTTVVAAILPFNALKGLIIGVLFVPVFIKLRPWIEQKRMQSNSSSAA
ncbi:ECF transporter S component [Halobacillus salinarum]|uniref:Riboflavin transporter n=1 Tax=Halobacillus salinarum TaxID=2932257 RepID=A0ABY4ENN3_9BACI|nr:ECF transporter S component [Halobacillus salinarum]UOQ46075.1 ECF transporter S component [Halobacillus salinarum]